MNKLQKYIRLIGKHYDSSNPFHNALHAADVVHAVHYFTVKCGVGDLLDDALQFALIVAAAIHDVGHPAGGFYSRFVNSCFMKECTIELRVCMYFPRQPSSSSLYLPPHWRLAFSCHQMQPRSLFLLISYYTLFYPLIPLPHWRLAFSCHQVQSLSLSLLFS